jgi:hypothetical protein
VGVGWIRSGRGETFSSDLFGGITFTVEDLLGLAG